MPLIRDWSSLLAGRTAVVTGAGGGVGRVIAEQLALAGASVWINDLDLALAQAAADEIRADGGDANAVRADVTDLESVFAMAETTGPLDIVVNNAGSGIRAFADGTACLERFVDTGPEQWAPIVGVNLDGVFHTARAYLPGMLERQWGRILTIVSDAGRKGERMHAVYGAAKAGAMGFTRGIAAEVGRAGITANCIALGSVPHGESGRNLEQDPERNRAITRGYPVGRVGRVDDPAPLATLLCSDAAEWITGQVYPVDGGYVSAL